jgi:TBC1 domain family member 20
MITWFAHELTRLSDVARLFDVLLVSHPLFILYLSAAVVIEARHRVLNTECDFGTLHGLLAKLPQTMEIERVIARAAVIFHRYPPVDLLATSEHRTELWYVVTAF